MVEAIEDAAVPPDFECVFRFAELHPSEFGSGSGFPGLVSGRGLDLGFTTVLARRGAISGFVTLGHPRDSRVPGK
jgi:hypothetical protein